MATKSFSSQSSPGKAIWSVCDILRRSNYAGAMQYVPGLTRILFLRLLDAFVEAPLVSGNCGKSLKMNYTRRALRDIAQRSRAARSVSERMGLLR